MVDVGYVDGNLQVINGVLGDRRMLQAVVAKWALAHGPSSAKTKDDVVFAPEIAFRNTMGMSLNPAVTAMAVIQFLFEGPMVERLSWEVHINAPDMMSGYRRGYELSEKLLRKRLRELIRAVKNGTSYSEDVLNFFNAPCGGLSLTECGDTMRKNRHCWCSEPGRNSLTLAMCCAEKRLDIEETVQRDCRLVLDGRLPTEEVMFDARRGVELLCTKTGDPIADEDREGLAALVAQWLMDATDGSVDDIVIRPGVLSCTRTYFGDPKRVAIDMIDELLAPCDTECSFRFGWTIASVEELYMHHVRAVAEGNVTPETRCFFTRPGLIMEDGEQCTFSYDAVDNTRFRFPLARALYMSLRAVKKTKKEEQCCHCC